MTRAKSLIYPLLVLIVLAGSVMALLGWMWRAGMLEGGQLSGLGQVLMLIVGMLTMATLEVLYGIIIIAVRWSAASMPAAHLRVLTQKNLVSEEPGLKRTPVPWEIDPLRTVGIDNSLALAKLRVEIEQELRRFHFLELNGESPNSATTEWSLLSAHEIIEELERNEKMSAEWRLEMNDVIATCDHAIHGEAVSTDRALQAIRSGEELLHRLWLPSLSSMAA